MRKRKCLTKFANFDDFFSYGSAGSGDELVHVGSAHFGLEFFFYDLRQFKIELWKNDEIFDKICENWSKCDEI